MCCKFGLHGRKTERGNYFKIQHSVSPQSGEKGGLRGSSVFLCCKQLPGTNKKMVEETIDNNRLGRLAGARSAVGCICTCIQCIFN